MGAENITERWRPDKDGLSVPLTRLRGEPLLLGAPLRTHGKQNDSMPQIK